MQMNRAREALSRVVNRAIANGAELIVEKPCPLSTYAGRYALLARYRPTVAPTLDGYPAIISGCKNDFATVATINGPAIRADFAWTTIAHILASGGAFKSR